MSEDNILRLFFFSFIVPPKFISTPGDLVTNLGDDIHFNCSASGDPEPKIYFRKVKVPHFRWQYDLNGFTFIIRNVSHSDVGLYRCFASSEAGVINTTFTLNVIGITFVCFTLSPRTKSGILRMSSRSAVLSAFLPFHIR